MPAVGLHVRVESEHNVEVLQRILFLAPSFTLGPGKNYNQSTLTSLHSEIVEHCIIYTLPMLPKPAHTVLPCWSYYFLDFI